MKHFWSYARSRRDALRQGLVRDVLSQWEKGLPIKMAAKILRKAGIHPWSLVPYAERHDLDRLAKYLHVSEIFRAACVRCDGGNLNFHQVDIPIILPERLALEGLAITGCHRVLRLPRTLWTFSLEVEDCRRLEALPLRGANLYHFQALRCPRLRYAGVQMREEGGVILAACPRVRVLPNFREIAWLTLKDLPELQSLNGIRQVRKLSLWRLPRLRDLSSMKVTNKLVIQDCQGLRWLPESNPEVRGSILDCPSLADQTFHRDVANFQMGNGTCSLPSAHPQPLPRFQAVIQPALPEFEIPHNSVAWPWPPHGLSPGSLDESLDRAGKLLGLNLLDRVRLHEGLGLATTLVVRDLMLGEAGPAQAVLLGADMLKVALGEGDERRALQICLAAEHLGVGALSLGLARRWGPKPSSLDSVLGPFWASRAREGHPSGACAPSWHHAPGIPGPLVLLRGNFVSQNTKLCWLDGPIWAAMPLWFSDCPRLERLPALIVSRGSLTIELCPRLVSFPRLLEVTGDLVLRNLPKLRAQECRIRVNGKVVVEDCPGLRLIPIDTP